MKWKHLCKERGVSIKGKVPKWFKQVEKEVIQEPETNTRKIKNKYIGNLMKSKIHVHYFDDNKKPEKNVIVTWNDNKGTPMFGEDKKRSKSKNHKKLGTHLIIKGGVADMDNSPNL